MSLLDPPLLVAGRYRLVSRLGHGGMGEVYRAQDEKLDREVALKRLPVSKVRDQRARRRLLREARASALIDHPGVVRVFHVGETDDGEIFIVMELVHGRNVRELLQARELDPTGALRVVMDVAVMLDATHRMGVVHRDIKPDNIMIEDGGRTVLLDFGVTKLLSEPQQGVLASTQLTDEGAVLGTPAYLSPEQANSDEIGPASDQFSLAVMAYELLCGQLPWTATNMYLMIAQILSAEPVAASSVNRELSTVVDAVLERALSKAPADRYPTATAFAEALTSAVVPLGLSALPYLAPRDAPAPTASDASDKTRTMPDTSLASDVGEPAARAAAVAPAAAGRAGLWRSSPAFVRAVGAVSLVVALGGGVWTFARHPGAPLAAAPPPPVSPLAAPDAVLACPILEAKGVAEPSGWLGAAAAACACQRAATLLGGSVERTLVPAELLDLPLQPVVDFPDDPYVDADARARSIRAAETRAQVYLDGSVAKVGRLYHVNMQLRRSSGEALATGSGEGTPLYRAVARALDRLADGPAFPKVTELSPEVARWVGMRRVDTMLFTQFFYAGEADEDLCQEAPRYRADLGVQWSPVTEYCPSNRDGGHEDLAIDRSSPEAFAQTAYLYARRNPKEAAKIAGELNEALQRETSPIGRALLATYEGYLWMKLANLDRARAAQIEGIRASARWGDWSHLAMVGGEDRYARAAAAWDPGGLAFGFQAKLGPVFKRRYMRRSYELGDDDLRSAAALAELYLSEGKREDVLGMAASHASDTVEQRDARDYLYALVARSQAKFGKALDAQRDMVDRAQKGGLTPPTVELMELAELLGRSREIADAWIERYVVGEGAEGRQVWGYDIIAPAMCMRASRDLAKRCFERVHTLFQRDAGARADGADALLRGAERHAAGDARAAVEAWRPLLRGNLKWFLRVIPIAAFDRAGEGDLAARLDADLLDDKGWSGVSLAHPRAARRAADRGDRERARELAQQTIAAWIDADAPVPAVSEMQALLQQIR